MVTPCVIMLLGKLDKLSVSTSVSGLGTMINKLKMSMETGFAEIESDQNMVLATILDPCYKDAFFQKESAEEYDDAVDKPTEVTKQVQLVIDKDDESDEQYAAILSEHETCRTARPTAVPSTIIQ